MTGKQLDSEISAWNADILNAISQYFCSWNTGVTCMQGNKKVKRTFNSPEKWVAAAAEEPTHMTPSLSCASSLYSLLFCFSAPLAEPDSSSSSSSSLQPAAVAELGKCSWGWRAERDPLRLIQEPELSTCFLERFLAGVQRLRSKPERKEREEGGMRWRGKRKKGEGGRKREIRGREADKCLWEDSVVSRRNFSRNVTG